MAALLTFPVLITKCEDNFHAQSEDFTLITSESHLQVFAQSLKKALYKMFQEEQIKNGDDVIPNPTFDLIIICPETEGYLQYTPDFSNVTTSITGLSFSERDDFKKYFDKAEV